MQAYLGRCIVRTGGEDRACRIPCNRVDFIRVANKLAHASGSAELIHPNCLVCRTCRKATVVSPVDVENGCRVLGPGLVKGAGFGVPGDRNLVKAAREQSRA